jgi:hypothetical protein
MRRLVGLAVVVALGGGAAFACRSITCEDNKTCTEGAGPNGDGGGPDGTSADGQSDGGTTIPPECEASPSANAGVLIDKCGVFVAPPPKGGLSNGGTKASPVQTFADGVNQAKLQNKAWVFVCKGSYTETETVPIDRSVRVFGKLD